MRKLTRVLLSSLLAASMLVGCNNNKPSNVTDGATENVTQTQQSDEGIASIADMTADDFSKLMGNGVNLGNTLEAYGRDTFGTHSKVSNYETAWGQPVTTQAMIQGYKNAGFDTLRIPVAWTNMMDYDKGDYTIDSALLDRVDEVIGWAVDAGMYVIVNDHWDGGWWGMFGAISPETKEPDTATREKAMEMYTAMWKQIAEKYAKYDEHLLFESANEEVGERLNDEINGIAGNLTEDECYEVAAKINQRFVDTVRATGGNNANRFLVIAGYDTDIAKTLDERFVMPTDSATSKLFVDVHYYTPWNFCGDDTEETHWGTISEYKVMNKNLGKLVELKEKGYGVIIGEHGPLPHADGSLREDIILYLDHLLDNCDINNYVPVLWDRGGLYSRTDCKLTTDELTELYTSRNATAEAGRDEAAYIEQVKAEMADELANAPEERVEEINLDDIDKAMAWIMWNGTYEYSIGDKYNPDSHSAGVKATDVEITGPGTYTVGLDFTKTEYGKTGSITFSAIGISWAEILYPGCFIENIQIKVNGEPYELTADYYTTTDDRKCTRVNLINEWVVSIPEEARRADGDLSNASPVIIDKSTFTGIETLEITFDFVVPEN